MDSAWDRTRPRTPARRQSTRLSAGWCLLVGAAIVVWIPELSRQYAALADPPAAAEPALQAAHLTARAHAWYHAGLDAIFGVTSIAIGALILHRRPEGHVGVMVAVTLGAWGPTNGLVVESMLGGSWAAWLSLGVGWAAFAVCVAAAVRLHGRVAFEERQRVRWLLYGR